MIRIFVAFILFSLPAQAQVLTPANVQIEWKVENRFRLFSDLADFKAHELAYRQYLIHVDGLNESPEETDRLIAATSVRGVESVLNDRYIPFSRHLRTRYDAQGWARKASERLCYDSKKRLHSACGEDFIEPKFHAIEAKLKSLDQASLYAEFNCEWRVGNSAPTIAPCDEPVSLQLPYPQGASISVNVEGESPISIEAKVKDLLIVGLGDSFASGEGNPDEPAVMSPINKHRNLYPRRARNDGGGAARWVDELCHRSLYGHQLRAALQIGIENPQSAVTFLGYSCSGAAIEEGILGPQAHMDYISRSNGKDGSGTIRAVSGSGKDAQLRWLLRELCKVDLKKDDGLWQCPAEQFRRTIDHVFLSVGGNDIGFSNLVTWATLRDNTTSQFAKFFGAAVSPNSFADNMRDDLPDAYARLAKAMEVALPLRNEALAYDASRVVLTAYPDILEDENGQICPAGEEGDNEDQYAANQSLDYFSSWLVVTSKRLTSAHAQLAKLHTRMGELAEDHGWRFAGRAYEDKSFRGHGFCARKKNAGKEPAEALMIPCWGKAERDTQTCSADWSGDDPTWRPYDPVTEHYPYALRQRWVRTFNDAYMVINQKAYTREGRIDPQASEAIFAETTGAMHPTAEGHAAMADALLLDLRKILTEE